MDSREGEECEPVAEGMLNEVTCEMRLEWESEVAS